MGTLHRRCAAERVVGVLYGSMPWVPRAPPATTAASTSCAATCSATSPSSESSPPAGDLGVGDEPSALPGLAARMRHRRRSASSCPFQVAVGLSDAACELPGHGVGHCRPCPPDHDPLRAPCRQRLAVDVQQSRPHPRALHRSPHPDPPPYGRARRGRSTASAAGPGLHAATADRRDVHHLVPCGGRTHMKRRLPESGLPHAIRPGSGQVRRVDDDGIGVTSPAGRWTTSPTRRTRREAHPLLLRLAPPIDEI